MATTIHRGDDKWKVLLIVSEGLLLMALLVVVWLLLGRRTLDRTLLSWALAYLLAVSLSPPVLFRRSIRWEQIAASAARTTLLIVVFFYILLTGFKVGRMPIASYLLFALAVFVVMFIERSVWFRRLRRRRSRHRDAITVVFVGDGEEMLTLYNALTDDIAEGYSVAGYFAAAPSSHLPPAVERLGSPADVCEWLQDKDCEMVFCNLPTPQQREVQKVINYCENHGIHFFAVPNVVQYMRHEMSVQFFGEVVVLALRDEPLAAFRAKMIKRTFDIVFSFLVCALLLWWLIPLVAIVTKLTMPGPVFFRQQRNGLNNRTFTCLKFRTMVVNSSADEQQATRSDSRITKWGHFMRTYSIDELPQFLNVLKGDMSVVGPRPHMLKHNDEYGKLIDKYMVRTLAKPGITGRAQVSGSRGETRNVSDMEQRIVKDIWYIEHWTFWLDILIIGKTVINIFTKDRKEVF